MKIESHQIELREVPSFFKNMCILGLVSGLISLAGLFLGQKEQFFFSSLTAGIFAMGIGIGALFFVMIHYLSGAKWSVVIRRVSEHMAFSTPFVVIVLAIVILFGMHHLYEWSNSQIVEHDHLLQKKKAYLNVTFFVIRMVFYFGVWAFLTHFFRNVSIRGDASSEVADSRPARNISPVGMIFFAFTVTFAAFDWVMSLDAHWYSTIFGVYMFAGYLVSFFATSILVLRILQKNGYLNEIVTVEHYHDLGKLMFAFTCFWAFCAFSQYMLIWYGNIPEETVFYKHRWVGAWKYISLLLPIGHFALPFIFLMARPAKRNLGFLSAMAIWMLVMHFVDLHWLILPNLHHEGFHFSWLDATTLVAFVGIFFGILGRILQGSSLIPLKDEDLEYSLQHVSR